MRDQTLGKNLWTIRPPERRPWHPRPRRGPLVRALPRFSGLPKASGSARCCLLSILISPPFGEGCKAVKGSRGKSPRRTKTIDGVAVPWQISETDGRTQVRRLNPDRAATQYTSFFIGYIF